MLRDLALGKKDSQGRKIVVARDATRYVVLNTQGTRKCHPPRLRGKAAVKAAKRARQQARLRAA